MKNLKSILFAFAICTVFNSCTKKAPAKSDCEIYKYGTITISNSSSNPYDIDIDGVFQVRLNGGNISAKIKLYEGNNRLLHCKQVSGYLLFPTEKSSNFNVISCSDYTWQIP